MTAAAAGRPAVPRARLLRGRDTAGALVAALLVAGVVAVVVFRLGGGTWFIVQTPSMGTAAPVGTLLVDEPARVADLRVGDVITFHPPTAPSEVYSHRVAEIDPSGLRTRGDINGADDGWTVRDRDVIGRAVAVLPGIGWLVRGLPIIVAGLLLTALLTRWRPGIRRALVRLVGASLSVGLAAAWLHPVTGMVLLTTAASGHAIIATVAGTGLLPTRVSSPYGPSMVLAPGQVGQLRVSGVPAGHRVLLTGALVLPWWGWIALVAVCVAPLAVSLAVLARHRLLRRGAPVPA